jgi:PIN domain nuclease of toxin-antitoxin system
MRLLLDTQILIWWLLDNPRLGQPTRALMASHPCLVSVISDAHVIETGQLPAIHEDPFDRLLIAQARLEGLMAVSADAHWPAYDLHLHRA